MWWAHTALDILCPRHLDQAKSVCQSDAAKRRLPNFNGEDVVKKLTMKLDDLRVDSFITAPETRVRRGTVQAHLNASFSQCYEVSGMCGDTIGCFDSLRCDQTMGCYESMNCP